jgi:hypothetical protein
MKNQVKVGVNLKKKQEKVIKIFRIILFFFKIFFIDF